MGDVLFDSNVANNEPGKASLATLDADITLNASAKRVVADSAGAAVSVNLPALAALRIGDEIHVSVPNGTSNPVNITPDAADTIEGGAAGGALSVASDYTLVIMVKVAANDWQANVIT